MESDLSRNEIKEFDELRIWTESKDHMVWTSSNKGCDTKGYG
jgi:hypothetical protein